MPEDKSKLQYYTNGYYITNDLPYIIHNHMLSHPFKNIAMTLDWFLLLIFYCCMSKSQFQNKAHDNLMAEMYTLWGYQIFCFGTQDVRG